MTRRHLVLLALATGGTACGSFGKLGELPGDTDGSSGGTDGSSGGSDSGGTGGTGGGDADGWQTVHVEGNHNLDILVVMDNSGSMAFAQGKLAATSFIDVLEGPDVEAEYRIAVTTTDNGNPWCSVTTLQGGALRATSCRERLDEFLFGGTDPPTDVQAVGCTDVCQHDAIEILPSVSDGGSVSGPHPWLEGGVAGTNVGEIPPAEALACMLPQGVNGCGFESPMESMYKALRRSQDPNEASFGFMRPEAHLAVLFLTDEVDCSHNNRWEEIFLAEGNRVLWSDPNANFPTSAVCWNAGVECTGGPGTYDECHAADKDVNGNAGASAGAAVLHPVSKYIDFLEEIEAAKDAAGYGAEVRVVAIGGATQGYPIGQDLIYQDSADPVWQNDFGIGPGCASDQGEALPPVRLRELGEAFSSKGDRADLHSICASDFSPALEPVVEMLAHQVTPACVEGCPADTSSAPGLQPSCEMRVVLGGNQGTQAIPRCETDGTSWNIPTGEERCYRELVDPDDTTPSPIDQMDSECVAAGSVLQVVVELLEGSPLPAASKIQVRCEPDPNGC